MKMYLKIFFLMSALGTAWMFFPSFIWPISDNIALGEMFVSALIVGLIVGISSSLFFGTIHNISTNWYSKGDCTSPIQSATLIVSSPLDEATAKCQEAILGIGASIDKVDAHSGQIEASTKISWKSFGEKISLKLNDRGDLTTEVQVLSRPERKMTIVDYGKGRENVDKIVALLT